MNIAKNNIVLLYKKHTVKELDKLKKL
ncbi:hypothetical protein DSL72_007370 [Monilinia vaccinii-corymbosi]|uniref:Uncharacterized protein n=1 Tax=Monilinia vaccinii-corymbosi TaxID=61207 RepID=A0A8A3PMU4_9HELO|nr:hypothetical protein DSL72_007370 [Monilinia vaccinii-corymbosi]